MPPSHLPQSFRLELEIRRVTRTLRYWPCSKGERCCELINAARLPLQPMESNCGQKPGGEFVETGDKLIHRQAFRTRAQAHAAIVDYIEGFYNPIRRHSALGYRSSWEFEA